MSEKQAYYIDKDDPNFSEDYSILKGPNDFCCMLGEPEDSNWYRDGSGAVIELNRLKAENTKLKNLIRNALRIKDLWFSQSDEPEYQEESIALAAMLHHFEDILKEKP